MSSRSASASSLRCAAFADTMTVISIDFSPRLVDVATAAMGAIDYAITQHADIVPLLQEAQQTAQRALAP